MKLTHPLPPSLPIETLALLTRLSQVIESFVTGMWFYRMPRHDTPWGVIPAIDMSILNRVRTRMFRAEAAIKSLMLRFRAGKLRPPAPRGPHAKPRTHTPPTQKPLPGHFGWFCPLMPAEAGIRGNYIAIVLAEPEMQELLAASPRARAILKPICRMLAIDPRVLTPVARIREAQSAVATPIPSNSPPHTPSTTPPPPNPPVRPVPS